MFAILFFSCVALALLGTGKTCIKVFAEIAQWCVSVFSKNEPIAAELKGDQYVLPDINEDPLAIEIDAAYFFPEASRQE